MQAFVYLTLFALLFVISATVATSPTNTKITGNARSAPANIPATANIPAGGNTTPAGGNTTPAGGNTTPAPATPTTPAGGNTTPAPATPTTPAGGNTTPAPATPTTPAGGNTTPAPATPTTPAGGNTTPAPATPTTPAGGNTTPAPATPTTPAGGNTTPAGGNTTPAPATPTTPAGGNTTPAGGNTTPAGGNTTPAPATPTTPAGGNTTPAPATPTTPAGGNTTPAPATPTTPAGGNSTAPAGTNNTTPTPAAPTTFIRDNSPGTVPSVTYSTVTSLKTSNPNPDTTNTCQDDPCTGGSYCVNLNNTHFCLCIDGFYYNSSSCKKGKVFPGIIQVKTPDTSDLENKKSINYEKLHKEVIKFFADVFKNSDYGQTVIKQVSIPAPARSQMRAGDQIVNVTVVNLFAEATKENEITISAAILKAISSSSSIANYTNQDRCEFYGCVKKNDCSNGFQCECQKGYERPNPYTTCLPLSRRCPYACNSKPNMQCLMKDNGSPDCVCLAGYKKDDHEKCQVCAFGYNGVNCEDNFQLILTVLGTIAGILILGMVIALIFMRSKKTKDIEEQHLIENDFQNLKLQQTTGFSSSAEGSIFPRITASFPRDGGMQNPYANSRGIPRPDY